MNGPFTDISDIALLTRLLNNLTAETRPLWGSLTPQAMIEHLATAVQYTNGQKFAALEVTEEEASTRKQQVVRPELIIPKNVKGPLDDTAPLRYKDLSAAIEELLHQVQLFHTYYSIPGRSAVHPTFGALSHEEWLMWHGKHFAHHFTQFGLLPE